MPFPSTFQELKNDGYMFDNDAQCRGCRKDIEWWTTPKRRKLPFDPMPGPDSPAVPHFSTCPDAANFRKDR